MRPLDLEEWADGLYRNGTSLDADFAREVLDLLASDCTDRFYELSNKLEYHIGERLDYDDLNKRVEKLCEDGQELEEIADVLDKAKARNGDIGDDVRALIDRIAELEDQLMQVSPATALGLEFDL